MNSLTTLNDKLLARYVSFRAGATHLMHASRNRDAGQGSIEYVGLLLIVGAAMAIGAGVFDKLKDAVGVSDEGVMTKVIKDALESGLKKALEAIGVSV